MARAGLGIIFFIFFRPPFFTFLKKNVGWNVTHEIVALHNTLYGKKILTSSHDVINDVISVWFYTL